MTHNNLGASVYPDATGHEDSVCKSCSGQGMEKKLETIPARDLRKVKSKKEVILEAQRDNMRVHFASLTCTTLRNVQYFLGWEDTI